MTMTSGKPPVAVITGAAGGMGMACARLLGRNRHLVLTDAREDALEAAATTLRDEGYRVESMAGDLADPSLVSGLAAIAERTGALSALVNCAGLSPVQAEWRQIVRVNFEGATALLDAFEPLAGRGTACVMIASVAGHLGPHTAADTARLEQDMARGDVDSVRHALEVCLAQFGGSLAGHAYSLTKRAIIDLCERRAPVWGRKGARILSLSPGMIWTPMGRVEASKGDRAQALLDSAPLERWGTPMDIATTVEFLLSDAASYITGCDIRVDGGAVAAMRGQSF